MSTKKILWSIPRSFLPISDGASKANDALLSSFFSQSNPFQNNFEVTLLLFIDQMMMETEDLNSLRKQYLECFPIYDVVFIKKDILGTGLKRVGQLLLNFFTHYPLTASFFDLRENRGVLEELAEQSFDYVLCDGLHPYCGLRKIFKRSQFIYRSHNVEYNLWNLDSLHFITKMILRQQGNKMKELEGDLITHAKGIWCISEEDRLKYLSDFSTSAPIEHKIDFLPMALPFKKIKPALNSSGYHFLFLGKLDWHPNQEGLLWFLREVAPKLNSKVSISIAGKGDFPYEEFSKKDNISFLGFVEDLGPLYEECDACLIPIFSGSGTRIKVLEALAHGLPLISTSFGIQGSGMNANHCTITDESEKWVNYLNKWDRVAAHSKASLAQRELASLYGDEAIQVSLQKVIS